MEFGQKTRATGAHWLVYLVGIGGNLTVASGNVGKICRLLLSLIRRGSDGRLVS